MTSDPWLRDWNYQLMVGLFRLIPHSRTTDGIADLLVLTPLLSTWIVALYFYRYWTKDDGHRASRRRYLLNAVMAFAMAAIISIVIRPWVHWPAPVLNPSFQALFPRDLWGSGSKNCFPSHSTLAYFTMAAGFWPLHRGLSIVLSTLALLFVSLPRVYAGGHYPIDVIFSCVLGFLMLIAVWRWPVPVRVANWLVGTEAKSNLQDWLFFLWTFELGEGFRSAEVLAGIARRLSHWP
jgi:membrane-associated phospholipid phosphatase